MWWALLACVWGEPRPEPELESDWQQAVADWRHPEPLPSLPYVDRSGNHRTAEWDGQWTLLGFVFTRCGNAEACPLTMRRMVGVQEGVSKSVPLQFVVFTIDPDFDTPERLRDYGVAHGVDANRWTLATGDRVLMREALPSLFNVYALGSAPEIQHPVKVVLLGPDQRERATWTGAFTAADVMAVVNEDSATLEEP